MPARVLTVGALALASTLWPAAAPAHEQHVPVAATALAPGGCPGRAIQPDRVITGEFGKELEKSYVLVPFGVPHGTTAVRVKYCFDQPELSSGGSPNRHTLDLGLYGPRRDVSRPWGPAEFRGWGGSSHPDVTVSAEGFSSEEHYTADPRVEEPGKTTRAFRPGPIRPGTWAVELGVAAVIGREQGDADGKVAWRVEIDLASNRSYADEPYRPAPYRGSPARRGAGWYAGDFHVHAEHSAYGDATMRETFGYAFRSLAAGGAGLDFITLSDYVSGSAWGEIGRHQGRYPGRLVARSAEVITYRGHANNHNSARVVDYREGTIHERRPDGSLRRLRGTRDASALFDDVHRFGGYTQVNHPTIFPPTVPGFAAFCRGCFWEYSDGETRWEKADAYEIATGPADLEPAATGPNPFTVTALAEYERILGAGFKVAAVGSSDSHNAGRTPSPVTQAPIGEATTVVFAEELSEPGIECGVEAGHTYVKVAGNDAPDLRFSARPAGGRGTAIVGDTVHASGADFAARVLGGAGRTLLVVENGRTVRAVPVAGDDFTHRFSASGSGRWRLQLMRGSTIEAASSPIWLEPGAGTVERRDCRPLRVRGLVRRRTRVRRGRFAVRCRASGARLRSCSVRARVSLRRRGRRRTVTVGSGRAATRGGTRRVTVRLNRTGRRLLARRRGGLLVRLTFTARDAEGTQAHDVRRSRLVRTRRARRGAPRRRAPAFTG